MRIVIQRSQAASVMADDKIISSIDHGMVILVGIEEADTEEDIQYLSRKIINLRIFADEEGIMNLSILQSGGSILLISQFTLMAQTHRGNRPSYIRAARPEIAEPLYLRLGQALEEALGKPISYGQFGADMSVSLINDGPVTILIDSKHKE